VRANLTLLLLGTRPPDQRCYRCRMGLVQGTFSFSPPPLLFAFSYAMAPGKTTTTTTNNKRKNADAAAAASTSTATTRVIALGFANGSVVVVNAAKGTVQAEFTSYVVLLSYWRLTHPLGHTRALSAVLLSCLTSRAWFTHAAMMGA